MVKKPFQLTLDILLQLTGIWQLNTTAGRPAVRAWRRLAWATWSWGGTRSWLSTLTWVTWPAWDGSGWAGVAIFWGRRWCWILSSFKPVEEVIQLLAWRIAGFCWLGRISVLFRGWLNRRWCRGDRLLIFG